MISCIYRFMSNEFITVSRSSHNLSLSDYEELLPKLIATYDNYLDYFKPLNSINDMFFYCKWLSTDDLTFMCMVKYTNGLDVLFLVDECKICAITRNCKDECYIYPFNINLNMDLEYEVVSRDTSMWGFYMWGATESYSKCIKLLRSNIPLIRKVA